MRVQLLSDHVFHLVGGNTIGLRAGSFIGASAGDFPVASILNFAVTLSMLDLDGAATTAIGTEQTRVTGIPGPPGGGGRSGNSSRIPQPTRGLVVAVSAVKAWETL